MYSFENLNISIDEESEEKFQIGICQVCVDKKEPEETLLINIEQGSWFCDKCGFHGNLMVGEKELLNNNIIPLEENPYFHNLIDFEELNEQVINNFATKKISKETLDFFNIKITTKYFESLKKTTSCLVYPYYKKDKLFNLIYYTGKYKKIELGGVEICFNYNGLNEENTYITLNEMECMSLHEIGIKNVIGLFGGFGFDEEKFHQNKDIYLNFLTNIEEELNKIKKFTIMMPNNKVGNIFKDELVRRFGKERCFLVELPSNKMINDLLVEDKKEIILENIKQAKAIPIRGIFDIDDVEDDFEYLYENGLTRGALTGFPTLDEYYTVVPGQVTIVTGIPGHGKSNLLDAIMVNLADNESWKFAIFSPENQPIARHYASMLEKKYKKSFEKNAFLRISKEEKDEGKKWLRQHFSVLLPHEDDSSSIDSILTLAKAAVFRKGIKGLIIDPWNELDHSRPTSLTETEYISSVLTKIRKFARNYDVHVWIVAHPAKLYKDKDGKYPVPTPYDISGSAHFRNKADNCLTAWRNVGFDDQNIADVHVQKIRYKEVGRVGLVSLRFDSRNSSFYDDVDQNKRKKALESGTVINSEQFKIGY